MHAVDELIHHGIEFALAALNAAHRRSEESLRASAATPSVIALQTLQLQRTVLAVGVFSMFEAILQDRLKCVNGFHQASRVLAAKEKWLLHEQFSNLHLAINVLKHGRGRSYDALVEKVATLPFRLKLPNENFFSEGDVSEIATLIQVDDDFVRHCVAVIRDVANSLDADLT